MRTLLLLVVAFVGASATLLGLLMLAYPMLNFLGASMDLLRPSLLNNYLFPGIIFTILGSINLAALFAYIQQGKFQYSWTIAGGLLTIAWVIIESVIMQTLPWLYITYLFFGLFIILLSWQLKGKWVA